MNFYKMAAAAILDFSEVKSDGTGSRGLPVSTSVPNLVKISQKAPELWQFMCFQNGGRRHLEFTSVVDFLHIDVLSWGHKGKSPSKLS